VTAPAHSATRDAQEVLIEVLTSTELFRRLLDGDIDGLAGELVLSDEQAQSLRAINLSGVRRFRAILQEKHLRHAEAVLPRSLGCAQALHDRATVREALWTRAPLPADPLADLGRRYLPLAAGFLADPGFPVPAWLSDVARYERMLAELRMEPAGEPDDGTYAGSALRLAGGVRLEAFDWDVTTILPSLPGEVAAVPGAVRLVGRALDRAVQVRKVNGVGFAVLDECRQPSAQDALISRVLAGDTGTDADTVARFIAYALRMGLLVAAEAGR
jgi:hypothetical protein